MSMTLKRREIHTLPVHHRGLSPELDVALKRSLQYKGPCLQMGEWVCPGYAKANSAAAAPFHAVPITAAPRPLTVWLEV